MRTRSISKQTYRSLSGILILGLLGLVGGDSYGLDRLPVPLDPEQKAHADYAHRIRTSKGLRHLFACGGHLSPTFLSLSREIRERDVELTIRYDAHSPQTYAELRLFRTVGGIHMASVIHVPHRSRFGQLGSIGHELHHMLTVLHAGKEGLLSVAEESRAKEVATRIEKEAVSQYHKDRRRKPPGGVLVRTPPATEASSLSC